MGYYIEVPVNTGKVQQIIDGQALGVPGPYQAEEVPQPALFDPPDGKALICVVVNRFFEAAGFCFSKEEFAVFSRPDGRPKRWLLMDLGAAVAASGCPIDRA